MNKNQIAFCEEYIKTYNAAEAYRTVYIDAKHPDKSAYKLLKKPYIQEYIRELQQEVIKHSAITAEKVLINLDKIANNPNVSTNDRLKALSLIQKQLGLDKTVISSDNIEIKVSVNNED